MVFDLIIYTYRQDENVNRLAIVFNNKYYKDGYFQNLENIQNQRVFFSYLTFLFRVLFRG
jgi:hypothetical protein